MYPNFRYLLQLLNRFVMNYTTQKISYFFPLRMCTFAISCPLADIHVFEAGRIAEIISPLTCSIAVVSGAAALLSQHADYPCGHQVGSEGCKSILISLSSAASLSP